MEQYQTEFSEISVGCEACHGSAGQHVEAQKRGEGTATQFADLNHQEGQINACSPCHSRREQLRDGFSPELDYFDFYRPALLREGLYHVDGQAADEVYVYGSFLQSKMHQAGVKCSDCHNPHSGEPVLNGDQLCLQCHSEAGEPRFPQLKKQNYQNGSHHHHAAPVACVDCHMTQTTVMKIDDRRDHSFRIPRSADAVDLDVPLACMNCHQDQSRQWALKQSNAWWGELAKDPFAQALFDGRDALSKGKLSLMEIASDKTQPSIKRATAAQLIGNYVGDEEVAHILKTATENESTLLRIGAIQGARGLEPSTRWAILLPLLSDRLLVVRMEAIRSIVAIYSHLSNSQRQIADEAALEYLAILDFNADNPGAQQKIAEVYRAQGDFSAAKQALQKSLHLNSNWVPAMINLADLYRSQGDDDRALPWLQQAHSLAPKNHQVLLSLGLWRIRNNQREQGVTRIEEAWQVAKNDVQSVYTYMIALSSEGDTERALEVADTYLAKRNHAQIVQAAYSIAQDAGMKGKAAAYIKRLSR